MNNNQNDPSQMNAMVDEIMKDFDVTKLQAFGYDKIQELANKYLASEDPEIHAVGQELKNIDPKIFELTPAEKQVKEIHELLVSNGKTSLQADRFAIQMLELASEKTVSIVISAMNEDTLAEWKNLNAYGPNMLQQMYMLDQTAKLLLKKSFDDIYEESLNLVVEMSRKFLELQKESAVKVENLTEEQVRDIQAAFDSNQYEIAIQLIYDYAHSNGSAA